MRPDLAALYAATEATWPPARRLPRQGFVLRAGAGGGQRVSAATAREGWTEDDIAGAEDGMRALGQRPLFMVRMGEDALDAALAARGYTLVDPVNVWVAPVGRFSGMALPRVTVFDLWEPLAIMREIWAAGGVGPERLAVMARVAGPRTALFGRIRDKPGGVGFCAIHDGTAMVHALEIAAAQRRQGLGRWMMIAAAQWAERNGATHIAVLCTVANDGANGLYAALGFEPAGRYHYRRTTLEDAE
ncbi:GNAT family N-acetyltransferase [Roseivivax isoporae]|uniref:Acetyltransferase n=1 Tax=Roseivivax isoporae LMG 25204 TaxID=1449351 RepID=X7FEE2_9RHOB|nr:GNAT family N-acetyltransferase [Roseivivax isoporae]ETX30441.1 acetyltransferase [Roseivivax isoporae LMG 25204]